MALARIKTWIAGEVLSASDLNSEFNNIISNAASLFSPLTSGLDCDGYAITLDAAAATTLQSTTAIGLSLVTGAKSGTPGSTGSIANFTAHTFTDSNTAGSGTAASYKGVAIARPTLVATNASVTTTNAATVYIENAPAASTNETITNALALWVDDGISRFDGAVNMAKGADIASASTLNLTTATGNLVHVTGTTTITGVTLGSGMSRTVIFDGILTLTHHATNNNLPGGANITTAAGDRALYWSDGTTVYCVAYQKSSGKATVAPAVGDVTGLGTGVATALAVNVGSAGAPVVLNGALGTPASGDITNLAASQAQQETGTALTVAVTPGRQHYHPSACKGWAKANMSGGAEASYNVSSITDAGVGNAICNWGTDFSSASYAPHVQGWTDATGFTVLLDSGTSAAAANAVFRNTGGADTDPNYLIFTAFGDQ